MTTGAGACSRDSICQLLLEALEKSPDALAIYGSDDRLIHCNTQFVDWFFTGQDRENLIGRTIQELTVIATACGRIVACNGKRDWPAERLDYHRRPGEPYEYLLDNGIIIQGREQGLPGGGSINQLADITRTARMAADLRESVRRYRDLFERAAEGAYRTSFDGSFLEVNPAYARLHGCESPDEFLRCFPTAVEGYYIDPGKRADFVDRVSREGEVRGYEAQVFTREGEIIWISESARTVRSVGGWILGFEGIAFDITARKTAEAERDASEQRFRDFARMSADWFWETDLEQRYTWHESRSPVMDCVEGLQTIVGMRRHELLEASGAEPNFAAEIDRIMAKGHSFHDLTYRINHPGRGEVWLRFSGLPIYGEQGRIIGYRGIGSDITDQRHLERELKRQEEVLLRAQKLEAVGTLASGMAHDLNNMLLPIILLTENVIEALPSQSRTRYDAERVLETAERAASLLRHVLDFSRADRCRPPHADIAPLMTDTLPLVAASLPRSVKLKSRIRRNLGPVGIDLHQLTQILLNLAANAVDAMNGAGLLYVGLDRLALDKKGARLLGGIPPGPYVRIRVRDTGAGIDAQHLPRIFDPFFTTKDVGKGTGLGLSVVHGIVAGCGGGVEVTSVPGKGTTFDVYLPLLAAEDGRIDRGVAA